MKLLLTSAGIYNKSIEKALLQLLGKPFKQSKIIYITTASNVETGDKSWLINDFIQLKNLNPSLIDLIDISAVPKNIWLPRIKNVDIIIFGGGNPHYLVYQIEKSGLKKVLPELLKNKIYIGISAGSMITTNKLSPIIEEQIFQETADYYQYSKNLKSALRFVNFQICPHLGSKYFPKNNPENVKKVAKELKETIYTIDDNTAIMIDGKKQEIISEGKWYKFN